MLERLLLVLGVGLFKGSHPLIAVTLSVNLSVNLSVKLSVHLNLVVTWRVVVTSFDFAVEEVITLSLSPPPSSD